MHYCNRYQPSAGDELHSGLACSKDLLNRWLRFAMETQAFPTVHPGKEMFLIWSWGFPSKKDFPICQDADAGFGM